MNKILEYFPFLSKKDVQSRAMGSQGTDIMLSEAAFKVFPFAVEAKNQESNKKLLNMWQQAAENTEAEGSPLLVISANDCPKLAILELDTLLHWVRKANE